MSHVGCVVSAHAIDFADLGLSMHSVPDQNMPIMLMTTLKTQCKLGPAQAAARCEPPDNAEIHVL